MEGSKSCSGAKSVKEILIEERPDILRKEWGLTNDYRSFVPLLPGKKNIGRNIKEEEKTHPKKQAIAIALNVARKSGAKIPKKGKR